VAAFEADHLTSPIPVQNSFLSVNSTEVEALKDIANYHRLNWQDGREKVALAEHKVFDYTDAAKKAGVGIWYNQASNIWEFVDFNSKAAQAYRHRPVPPNTSNSLGSKSHCGVEFVRVFDQYRSTQFARRLASKGKFHLV
jgi:hypothetical protein